MSKVLRGKGKVYALSPCLRDNMRQGLHVKSAELERFVLQTF